MGTPLCNPVELKVPGSDNENGFVNPSNPLELDAGALFVLKSRGSWWHCGYHLTTSIVGPVLLTLPFSLTLMGWVGGVLWLTLAGLTTFYSYNLLSVVLEHHAQLGHRQLRFRDMARDILGPRWAKYYVGPLQIAICFGAVISGPLVGGQCLKFIYLLYNPDGSMKLYQFIIICGVITLFLAQVPSFHSLRHINLISLLLCLTYGTCATVGSIYIEIQAIIAPPVKGKMFKGLCVCYFVVVTTYFSVGISGYWAFGNEARGTILADFMAGKKPLLPTWFLLMTNLFILLQVLAVTVVYLQPTNELFETIFADPKMGEFSIRNVVPRLFCRSLSVIIATVLAAMLPFFGDILALFGAFGCIPLDFILPMVFFNLTFKPSKSSLIFWGNTMIAVASSVLVGIGAIASVRQMVLDAKTYRLFADI